MGCRSSGGRRRAGLGAWPAPAPVDDVAPVYDSRPDDRVIRTGFAALDAILGPGGLPRSASVAIRGTGSSGRTTLSLRVAAEAQAQGSVVAWLDLSRSFDPVEAVARGVRLEWLVVITPASLDEGLSRSPEASSPAGRSTCWSSTCPVAGWPGPTSHRRSPTDSIDSRRSPGARRPCC